ncbi:MAG TPA: hypothetical protein VLM79_37190 [Kofleriaceae bacterium]|nr:hypothetical protein [Kofleriaceae bacterium]
MTLEILVPPRAARAVKALAALALCACSGTSGTLVVELTTAPGSQVLDPVQHLRLTLTNPREVVEADRSSSGFDVALEVDAKQQAGALVVEGFDASGALVACGESPPFSVAAITAKIVVYMAPPRSIAPAPVALPAALSEISSSPLAYGAVLAGGRDGTGAPSTAISIYNAYDHTLSAGLPMPGARTQLAIGTGSSGGVYLFGGTGPDGRPTGTLWVFDSTTAPSGGYLTVSETAELARTGAQIVQIGLERFLVTGAPPLTLDRGTLAARSDAAALPPAGATLTLPDGTTSAVFAGDPILLLRDGMLEPLATSAPAGASTAPLPGGRAVVIGGVDPALRDALVVDGTNGNVSVIANAIATPRAHPSLAATSRYLIVAGGTDAAGAPIASAEVLDATTLAPVVTLPILARSGMFAIVLPNDQVLLGGGAPASNQLELFTPDPPAL